MFREILQVNSTNYPGGVHSINTEGSVVAIVQKQKVSVKDCKGNQIHDIGFESHDVFKTGWNNNGDFLVIVYESYDHVTLWRRETNEIILLHTGFKDPSLLVWSSTHDIFIVGTKKGNLYMYDVTSCKSDTILGKHSLEITCGTWTSNHILVLGSNDKTISLSSSDGLTIQILPLGSIPRSISSASFNESCFITASMDSRLCFFDLSNRKLNVVKYPVNIGSIRCHFWKPDCSAVFIVTSQGNFISQSNPLFEGHDKDYKMLDFNTYKIEVCTSCVQTQSLVLMGEF